MRKITNILLSLTLAVLLCASLGLTAFAADDPVSVSVPVEVSLSGTLPDKAEDFTVEVEAADASSPMPEGAENGVYSMTVTGAAKTSFTISYDRVGVYEYTVSQVAGSTKDVKYDDTIYKLTVYVTNKEDYSGLEVSAVLYPNEETAKDPSAAFLNVYPTVVPSQSPTPTTPKTGDDFNLSMYVALAAVSAIVIISLAITGRRKNHER